MMRPRCMLIGWLVLAGCYHPAPPTGAPCDDRSPCPGGQQCVDGSCGGGSTDAPISEPDATLDGSPVEVDACVAPVACVNDQVVGCGPPVDCPWGCLTSGTSDQAHCGRITPSNVSWSLLPANPATVTIPFGAPWTLDTDDGTITSDNDTIVLGAGVTSVLQNGARVLALGSFVLEANTTLRVVGAHPLIVLAADSVTLGASSLIDLDGGCRGTVFDPTCAGAGGGRGAIAMTAATGCGPGGDGNENMFGIGEAGGGGGGMGTDGGNGGGAMAGFGPPGATCAQLGLYGGSGGGVVGVTAATTASGGRGAGGG
ncbi:MAG: hypothetical protein NT062_11205, partial [Proteobacteria bacterium]|nr:hypothetical protein [Pseudomonadota bacterium]